MADVCIRLFDIAGTMQWKLDELDFDEMAQNYEKYYRNKSFTRKAYELCQLLTELDPNNYTIELAIAFVRCWAYELGIDLEWHIDQKMQYNELRGRLHGKKY